MFYVQNVFHNFITNLHVNNWRRKLTKYLFEPHIMPQRLRQEDCHEFQARLHKELQARGYGVRLCLKITTKKDTLDK